MEVILLERIEKIGKLGDVVKVKDGYARKVSKKVIVIPEVNKKFVTPYSEAFQAVIWHCLVSHPLLQINKTKW